MLLSPVFTHNTNIIFVGFTFQQRSFVTMHAFAGALDKPLRIFERALEPFDLFFE